MLPEKILYPLHQMFQNAQINRMEDIRFVYIANIDPWEVPEGIE